jgi:hypothetical protein
MGAFAADAVRYAGDTLGNGAYFLRDEDGGGTDLHVLGNLTVDGTSALKGAVTVGTSTVATSTTLNGTLAVTGTTAMTGAAQCGSGFTVGGGLTVASGTIVAVPGVNTGLQAVTCTTIGASSDATVAGTVLIGTQPPASPQSQIRLIAGPPQPWAPVNPYLQIGDNVAGNAALRCQGIRTNEVSCFSTAIVVAAGATSAPFGPAMVGAGSYIVTIVETDNATISGGAGYYNMALEGILRSPTGTLVRVGTGTPIGGGPNGVTYTLTYNATPGAGQGMEMTLTNTSTATTPATFSVSVSCLSLVSYPD